MPHFNTTDQPMTLQGRDTEQGQPLDRKSWNIHIEFLNLFPCKNLCFKNCIHMANEFFFPFFMTICSRTFSKDGEIMSDEFHFSEADGSINGVKA